MVTVECRQRRSKVLTPSAIPCLRNLPSVNVTLGCAHGCKYCYIQGYANYPGDERVVLFVNTPEMIKQELRSMRARPERVFFSPSSDPFSYQPQVQEVTLASMRVLLEAGVGVAFLTKGFLTDACFDLFARFSGRVTAQVGITTLDGGLARRFEPRAAPPAVRMSAIRGLIQLGVSCTARLDPLLPDLTDTPSNLDALFATLAAAGVRQASASFLFLRSAFRSNIERHYAELGSGFGPSRWTRQAFDADCGWAAMLSGQDRTERLLNVAAIGQSHGIRVAPCVCKNPDVVGEGCSIAGRDRSGINPVEYSLFDLPPV